MSKYRYQAVVCAKNLTKPEKQLKEEGISIWNVEPENLYVPNPTWVKLSEGAYVAPDNVRIVGMTHSHVNSWRESITLLLEFEVFDGDPYR